MRVGAEGVLSLAMVVTWTLMMNVAGDTFSIEQTQEYMEARAAARPVGVAWALLGIAGAAGAVVIRAQAKARQLRGYVRNERT